MNNELDFIKDMFDRIAPKYDFLNRLLSLRQDTVWRTQMVKAATLQNGSRVLDVACGTCDVALEISSQLKGQACIFGLDFSFGMLKLGKQKLIQMCQKNISLLTADALHLPFQQRLFDAVFIAFGIRNIMNRQRALTAFLTVLKAGGRLAVLELTTPQKGIFRSLYLLYFQKILPVIGSFFSKDLNAYTYLPDSVLNFPSPVEFSKLMRQAGFENVRFKQMTFGIVTLFVGIKP
ncbi:MAG: bifunctional demethylmenaquinone methyltransferase/2-methoxy-6-polyprenyl-1,4-benzoquinol methylase UbiE [Desulfobacula sp.]|nr:bifunctional demethylmenaquinone methyltransferase/2-methoxy-6-polyprenyl-1,4-benzoquinol methylase UbiE [Desulfobacula sp.]